MKRTLAFLLALVTVLSCLGVVFAAAEGFTRGDVSGDGKVNAIDYMLLKRYLMGTFNFNDERSLEAADIDRDGEVTGTDYRLLKRHVLYTYRISEDLPAITEVDAAFALELKSSIANGVMTVVLTVKDIKDGVQMQELLAALHYDPEQLTLLTNEIESEEDGTSALDCVVTLPGTSWETLSKEVLDYDGNPTGLISIGFVGINPNHILTAETPLELQFLFELKEGVTEATVTIPSDTVKSGYAPDDGNVDLTVYRGEGAATTAVVELPVEVPGEGDFKYQITDGEATVTGYNGKSGDVVIPDTLGGAPVTAIGEEAFGFCDSITSIEIPEGVTEIGEKAFWYCESLTSIKIPSGVTEIKYETFYYCRNLTNIELPDGLTTIGEEAFYNCESLTSIDLPDSLTTIGDYAFYWCMLKSIVIPEGVTEIGGYVFWDNALTSVTLPDGLTAIGNYAFWYNPLKHIDLPDSLQTIGFGAFMGCDLESIVIPEHVTTIEGMAFRECADLTSVVIPDSVTTIGGAAFYECTSLTSITIPASVTVMGYEVFAWCEALTDIYCEAKTQPDGWDEEWLGDCEATVHWDCNSSTPPILGDLGGDGKINGADYMLLKRAVLGTYILTEEQKALADINKDGKINGADYMLLKRAVMGSYIIK